jgi:hypothetical protein
VAIALAATCRREKNEPSRETPKKTKQKWANRDSNDRRVDHCTKSFLAELSKRKLKMFPQVYGGKNAKSVQSARFFSVQILKSLRGVGFLSVF